MLCIDLEYRSWWCPWRRRVRGYAPSRWYEMDESHFVAIVRAVRGEISEDEYCARMFGLPQRLIARLDPWHRYVLGNQLKWISSGDSITSRFFIRRIEGLLSPYEALNGMTLQQFMTVDTFFMQYADTVTEEKPDGEVERLCRMVAALYLRPGETYFADGKDEKVADIEGNAQMLTRRADRTLLWGVYMNWMMIHNWLSRAYPLLFPKPDPDDAKVAKGKAHKQNGWLDMFDSFMGDDVAHLDTYRRMSATDAFRLMNKRIRNATVVKK